MRCKVGDLAVIVRGPAFQEYLGQLVTCVELHGSRITELWKIDRSLDGNPDYWILVPDSCLRPIRPDSLDEETTESRRTGGRMSPFDELLAVVA